MKQKKKEPAEKLLSLTPDRETALEREGFISALYRPEHDRYTGKVLIMVGGSDGSYALTKLIAEQFVKRGLSVLALAYWNHEGLSEKVQKLPLEIIEHAAIWLREQGFQQIGMWGISLGAEYALLCGCYLPELITCVVGVSPINVCSQAFQKKTSYVRKTKLLEGSAFSFRGKDIPYTRIHYDKMKIFADSVRTRGLCLRSWYEGVVENASEEAHIPIETINGPILLLAADHDEMWQAKEASDAMEARVREKGFAHRFTYYHYPYASHFLLPYHLYTKDAFAIERKYPKECWASNLDSFEKTLTFLQEW